MTDKNKAIEAEVIEDATFEIVQTSIIPAKGKGGDVILFSPENKDRLIKAFVNAEIVHFANSTDEVKKLAKKYAKLEVKDKDDKKGYEAVKTAYSELVKIRTSTEKDRKALNEPYNAIKKGIDDHAKDNIIGVLSKTEADLKVQKDKFEKWEQEEKERLEKEAAERLDARIKELKEAGLTFDGELYVIGDFISMDAVSIGKQSDVDYNFFLEKVKSEKKKIDDAKAEAEAKAAKEKADQEAEKERLEKEAKDLRNEKIENREDKLIAIGLTQNKETEIFNYESSEMFLKLTYDEVAAWSKDDFNAQIEKLKTQIENDKKRIEDLEKAPAVVEPEKISDIPTTNGHGNYSGGFGGSKSVSKDDKLLIEDIENIENLLSIWNKTEVPELKTEIAKEAFATFKNEITLAKNKLIETLNK